MKISILTASYNEEKTLETFLDAVLSQRLLPGMEVEFLICDDGSTDTTSVFIERARQKTSSIAFRTLHNEINLGTQKTLNALFQLATGEVIVFIDADAIPVTSGWLVALVDPFIRGAEVIQGNYWTQYAKKTFVVREHEKWRRSASLRRFRNQDGTLKTVNTRNLAIRRNILNKVYDRRGYILNPYAVYGADTELGFVITQMGHSIVLQEQAVVAHDDPSSFVEIVRQKIRHGYHDGLIGISYPNGIYFAVYYPRIHDDVSLLFSIPIALAFAVANYLGLGIHAVRTVTSDRIGLQDV